MNSGDMPPDDEKQPVSAVKANFLDDLSHVMVAARRELSDQHGVITMRRLNRREYKNTLRDLLGVEINVSELPSDTGTGGFDTVGSNLFMSGNQPLGPARPAGSVPISVGHLSSNPPISSTDS
jgi:hypothetical protein